MTHSMCKILSAKHINSLGQTELEETSQLQEAKSNEQDYWN